jgi:hypothetical protein
VVLTMAYGVRRAAACGKAPLFALTRHARARQWLEFAQSLQVIALLTNTGVHVIMCGPHARSATRVVASRTLTRSHGVCRYSYYLLCSLGLRPPKAVKLFVTNSQIVQFVFRRAVAAARALLACVASRGPPARNAHTRTPHAHTLLSRSFACCVPFLYLHAHKGCSGFEAWAFNAGFNVLLLALFANFKRTTYAAASKGKGKAKAQ